MAVQESFLEEVRSELRSDGRVGIRWVELDACRTLVIRGEERVRTG